MCPTHQVPIEEVGELVESGTITAETEVMVEGMQNFVGLAEFVQMHGLEEELSITSTKTAARRRNFSAEVLADVVQTAREPELGDRPLLLGAPPSLVARAVQCSR